MAGKYVRLCGTARAGSYHRQRRRVGKAASGALGRSERGRRGRADGGRQRLRHVPNDPRYLRRKGRKVHLGPGPHRARGGASVARAQCDEAAGMGTLHPRLATIKGFMFAADMQIRLHCVQSPYLSSWPTIRILPVTGGSRSGRRLAGAAGARSHPQTINGWQCRAL
jgi:hypothetical protein